jgi:hypothetical protein
MRYLTNSNFTSNFKWSSGTTGQSNETRSIIPLVEKNKEQEERNVTYETQGTNFRTGKINKAWKCAHVKDYSVGIAIMEDVQAEALS